ncbi:hypothetical protein PRK78_005883 [Emydomyces testavorans]|uniref:WD40 repeat protein n=1 Tax=Emydomyces testavorans TaxID=2070801 RepID=A0AAF0DLJ5_9EURO|nr:hypothetical protein PRK78_005883 [Emydomyces testavorans]
MAAVGGQVSLLANVWKLLGIRHDIDDIILELLGRFSLEKVYSECDVHSYQRLVIVLLARLNAIYSLQRLSLPSESEQAGQYLGFLASWEVVIRSVEFVLQIVIEGRDSFWEVQALRDKYLAELLCVALRILALHPKPPAVPRLKERRDRFARIHGLLEKLFDNYPAPGSFLLLVCKEITDVLRTDPNALALPTELRHDLPNLATQLYPLPDCLSPDYVSTIVSKEEASEQWLTQFFALRDISHFVVGAFVQHLVDEGAVDPGLQAACAESRNAILVSLESFRIPQNFCKLEMIETFSEIFRLILPDTPSVSVEDASKLVFDEEAMDGVHTFCVSLNERQVIHRVSDAQMMNAVSSIMRNAAPFVDASSRARSSCQRAYALNCSSCHFVEHFQFIDANNLQIPDPESSVIKLPEGTKCVQCGEAVTVAREISFIRQAWNALKPIECNADTIGAERHYTTQFQLLPRVGGPGFPTQGGTNSHLNVINLTPQEPKFPGPLTPNSDHIGFPSPGPSERPHGGFPDIVSPISPLEPASRQDHTRPGAPFPFMSPKRTGTILGNSSSKSKSTLIPSRKKDASVPAAGDTSSVSTETLERQKLEEISLKDLITASKAHGRGKPKRIKVYLSQNSTYALFWTQPSLHIWDVGISPPALIRAISTESSCLMAAVTKTYLAYVIGTRDQKLTLRIMDLVRPTALVLEYRMPSTLWCRSIAMSPKENYVVIGFDNATVRFFRTTNSEQSREFRLHPYHKECKGCQPVDTLAFSADGTVLLASTRHPKMGMIQIYMWSFPFLEFRELTKCQYHVPLHESEDNGVSAAIYRPSTAPDENLVCITTWTQSGVPVLIQPENGHKAEIKPDGPRRRLGNRIQCAAFSPSGHQLGVVNDKGYLYQLSNLDSSVMECRKLATSKELTSKCESFAMSYMSLHEEESVVLAWVDVSKSVGYVKKVPITSTGPEYRISTVTDGISELPGDISPISPAQSRRSKESSRLSASGFFQKKISNKWPQKKPVELPANDIHTLKRTD